MKTPQTRSVRQIDPKADLLFPFLVIAILYGTVILQIAFRLGEVDRRLQKVEATITNVGAR